MYYDEKFYEIYSFGPVCFIILFRNILLYLVVGRLGGMWTCPELLVFLCLSLRRGRGQKDADMSSSMRLYLNETPFSV